MAAPDALLDLVRRFDENREAYRSSHYNETRVRREFIDPFFSLLGWDIDNRQGIAPAYQDVVHEDAIKIGGAHKAPDYSFRIGGARKFFVEAKKPAINLEEDIAPAFQLRRYAWSANLPLSVLTDFEEFAVYDCRVMPTKDDRASVARTVFFTYPQYADEWDEIASIFSKDAVLGGSLDKYANRVATRRGTATVDTAFLKEIESWRDLLARDLAANNPDLNRRELNFAVQMTIDRIVFLRMTEDRGIEEYGRLQALLNGDQVYARLRDLYRQADERYNSGLFHFRTERDREEAPDELTPRLTISDDTLRQIIRHLYYPDSPYEFSVLPIEVLGRVYEQFLGKVIDLSPDRKVTIEEKPEVRKAGGVYYTPKYIVDYIVEHTVGKLLEGKRPGPRGSASKLRILDPACGSGSFLIGAYEYLLDWHRDEYVRAGPEKHRKELFQGAGGEWRLTTAEKKRILLNNIYGVDIDPQAVEVTKLSLLLKVLEGETSESLVTQLSLFRERALPDLSNNIKCGNSLIGPDFYDNQQMALFDSEEAYRVNVFDWQREFDGILSDGGFDAVIGNPPYLNIDDTWGKGDIRQRYIKRAYPFVYNDKTDILFYFLAKAVELSRHEVSFIVSRAFLEAYKADRLRAWLAKTTDVSEVIDFRNYYVFSGVGITTAIVSLTDGVAVPNAEIYWLRDGVPTLHHLSEQKLDESLFQHLSIPQHSFSSASWLFAEKGIELVNRKVDDAGQPLGKVLHVGQGMQTGRNEVFGGLNYAEILEWGLRTGQYYTRARNSDIGRYRIDDSGQILLYLEDFRHFDDLPAGVRSYLRHREGKLKERAAYKRGDCEWWKYTWPLHRQYQDHRRILCPYLATCNRFALDEQRKFLGLTDTTVLYDAGQAEELRYILGLLNSRLLSVRFKYIGKLKSGGIIEYFWNSISKLPIRRIDFASSRDRESHDHLVELVDRMMTLQSYLSQAATEHERSIIQHQVDAVDHQIDRLVYGLYDLNDDEIAVVEASSF